jgi:hypothetical protein
MGIIGKQGPPQREDFYHEYEDSEEWIRLWHQRPDLWREERRTSEGRLHECEVYGGMGGPRWIYDPPEWVTYVPRIDEQEGRETQLPPGTGPGTSVYFLVCRRYVAGLSAPQR